MSASSPTTFSRDDFQNRQAVSALFDDYADADHAVSDLKGSGFADDQVHVAEQGVGATVTVTHAERLADAATILTRHKGKVGRAVSDADSADAGRKIDPPLHVTATPTEGLAEDGTGDSTGGGMFTPGSAAGGSGAGTAGGGKLFGS